MEFDLGILSDIGNYIAGVDPYEDADKKAGVYAQEEKKHLQYPLTDDHLYRGRVVFSTRLQSESNISNVGTVTSQESNNTPEPESESYVGTADEMAAHKGHANESISKDALPAGRGGTKCSLYLPQALSFADGVNYTNTDMGRIGEGIRRGLDGKDLSGMAVIPDVTGVTAAGVWKNAKSLMSSVKSNLNTTAGKYAAAQLSKTAPNGFEGGIKAGLKVSVNPNTRAVFESVSLRTFQFSFKMIAKSTEEAEEIKNIVKYFRTRLYPLDEKIEGVSVIYNFPDLFNIDLLYADDKGKFKRAATKILPCYLNNVTTVYNAASMNIRPDGNFIEVDLSLDFQEARALTRQEIAGSKDGVGY